MFNIQTPIICIIYTQVMYLHSKTLPTAHEYEQQELLDTVLQQQQLIVVQHIRETSSTTFT